MKRHAKHPRVENEEQTAHSSLSRGTSPAIIYYSYSFITKIDHIVIDLQVGQYTTFVFNNQSPFGG
jgi:hypothetical protein